MRAAMSERWRALCARVGGHESVEEDALLTLGMLETLYTHPVRAYHNMEHVGRCLEVFDGVSMLAEDGASVEFALWLHDCVFDPERPDNESRSADAAGMVAGMLGCSPDFVETVRRLILSTRHERTEAGGDAGLVSDIDLSVLGSGEEEYEAYRLAIREEFSFVGDAHFAQGRHAFLERMLVRRRVYSTGWFFDALEDRARANMEREVALLEGAVDGLGGGGDDWG